jgi:hypothetical protein
MPLFWGAKSLAVPLIVAWITCATFTSGQLLANTPGGLRPIANSDSSSTVTRCLNGTDCTLLQQSSSRDGSSSSKIHELVALGLDTLGEVLYQNHPVALEQISAAEADALVAKYGAAATALPSAVASGGPGNQGRSSDSSSSTIHKGITDALAVLLGQTGAAPAVAVPSTAATSDKFNAAAAAAEAPKGLPGAVADLLNAEIGAVAPVAAAGTTSTTGSSSSSTQAVSLGVQPAIMSGSGSSSDHISHNATINQGVTGSRVTPDLHQPDGFASSKGNVTQVVITSLKMSPVTVEQLGKIAGPGAAAVAWQDSLQDTLSNATANATGMPVEQIQTKISSVLNLVSDIDDNPTWNNTTACLYRCSTMRSRVKNSQYLACICKYMFYLPVKLATAALHSQYCGMC